MSKLTRLLVLLLLGLTPVLWFWGRPTILINGIDTNFPLNPVVWLSRRFFVWNPIPNAGADFSSSLSGLFFHSIQAVPYSLGASLQLTEEISLIFWFALIVFSAYIFSTLFFSSYPIRLLVTSLYAFNIYLFNSWENVKVSNLSLVATLPLLLYLYFKLTSSKSRAKLYLYLGLTGIISSGSGINPAYFATIILALSLALFGQIVFATSRQELAGFVRTFIKVVCILVLTNTYWLLPTINFILSIPVSGSITKIGFTNWLESLSQNTSFLNLIRLQGAWDWYTTISNTTTPLYIPYALNYFHNPIFILTGFLFPTLLILSLVSPLTRHYAKLAFTFGLMYCIGLFLGAGSHPPTGIIFIFLSDHLPFFSLFRSPWYIFTPLVILAQAFFVGLFIYQLSLQNFRGHRVVTAVLSTLLIIINLIYCYPLVTGRIFRPLRADTFYISFPDYLLASANWLKTQSGRLLTYPDSEIESFVWKYRGLESVIQLASNAQLIFPSLNDKTSPISSLISQLYLFLKRGQTVAASTIAAKLNITHLFNKTDQWADIPLPAAYTSLPKTTFGPWHFYAFPASSLPKIFSPALVAYVSPYSESSLAEGFVPSNTVMLNPEDSQVAPLKLNGDSLIVAQNTSTIYDLVPAQYHITVAEPNQFSVSWVNYHLPDTISTLQVDQLPSPLTQASSTDSFANYSSISLSSGKHLLSLPITYHNQLDPKPFYLSPSDLSLLPDSAPAGFGVASKGPSHIKFKVISFDPFTKYLVKLNYRLVQGQSFQLHVSQEHETAPIKTQSEAYPQSPDSNSIAFYFEPVPFASDLSIDLEAQPNPNQTDTKIFYSDVGIYPLFSNPLILTAHAPSPSVVTCPNLTFSSLSPVHYTGSISGLSNSCLVVFSENYSPGWHLTVKNPGAIPPSISHFTANTFANGWYISSPQSQVDFDITYFPQTYFIVGIGISLSTLLILLGIYLRSKHHG